MTPKRKSTAIRREKRIREEQYSRVSCSSEHSTSSAIEILSSTRPTHDLSASISSRAPIIHVESVVEGQSVFSSQNHLATAPIRIENSPPSLSSFRQNSSSISPSDRSSTEPKNSSFRQTSVSSSDRSSTEPKNSSFRQTSVSSSDRSSTKPKNSSFRQTSVSSSDRSSTKPKNSSFRQTSVSSSDRSSTQPKNPPASSSSSILFRSSTSSQHNRLPVLSNDHSAGSYTTASNSSLFQSALDTVDHDAAECQNPDNDDDVESNTVRRESDVWMYATRSLDRLTATCKQCNAVIKTSNFSTTGLIKHLRQVHSIKIRTPEPSAPPADKPKFPEKLKKELHDLIVKVIIEDSRSFNDFRKPGMIKLLKKIIPNYKPPHRTTVSRRLKRLNDHYQQRLRQQMSDVKKISITCDFWSDRSLRSYLCITGHFMTNDLESKSVILSFDQFYDRHHGIRVAQVIKQKLKNLNLLGKIQCITTDGASNMKTMYKNLQDLEAHWVWCVPHRFHLLVNNAFGFWPKKKKKKNTNNVTNKSKNKNKNKKNNKKSTIATNSNTNNSLGSQMYTADSDTADNDSDSNLSPAESTNILGFDGNIDENDDEETFWDDATQDQSNSQQSEVNDDTEYKSGESDEDNHDEPMDIRNLLFSYEHKHSYVTQTQTTNGNWSLKEEEFEYIIDEESFVDYMNNNNLIRDDWDLDLHVDDEVADGEIDKNIILQVLKKCRSFIKMLRESSVLSSYFDQIRRDMNKKRTLPFDCPTRWNSTFFLIDSFINSKTIIIKFFGNKNLYDVRRSLIQRLVPIELTHSDWELLADLRSVLKPVYLGTMFMSRRSYPTAGLCYYVVRVIRNYLMKNEAENSARIKSLKLMLLRQLHVYFYSNVEQLNILKTYAFFDPLGYNVLGDNDLELVEQEIKKIVQNEIIYRDQSPLSTQSWPSASSTTSSNDRRAQSINRSFLLACGEKPAPDFEKKSVWTLEEEFIVLKNYMIDFYREHKEDSCALVFWKKYHTHLPILAQVARSFLSGSGSSVPSKSAFSVSAYIARKERARLSAQNLGFCMFLKDKIATDD